MTVHKKARMLCKDFRKTTAQLREIMESEDENMVLEGYQKMRFKVRHAYKYFVNLLYDTKRLYWEYRALLDTYNALEKAKKKCYNELERYQLAKSKRFDAAYFSKDEELMVLEQVKKKQAGLAREKKKVEKLEQEYLIKQSELEVAIKDTNLAKTSYYYLSEAEIELFEEQRPRILAGVEKYGSISLACQHDAKITMRVSSIMHYAKKHRQFGEDLEIAKQVFKDSLDAEILDRALNGTKNPVFQKGEYIGDYAVKDNKLLVEVAKAKLPETYNPRVYQQAHQAATSGTTINILSFDGVDETKHGYAKNIGVVKSVDESGRVERITQAKQAQKMLEFYKEKAKNNTDPTREIEIIDVEPVKDDRQGGEE